MAGVLTPEQIIQLGIEIGRSVLGRTDDIGYPPQGYEAATIARVHRAMHDQAKLVLREMIEPLDAQIGPPGVDDAV